MSMRIGSLAACALTVAALCAPATAVAADTLPPMNATNGGPIIGGGGNPSQMTQQLKSLNDPNVQEVDGPDAAQFIAAAAGLANRDLSSPFMALQRALACQQNNAGFGARAYRRNDGLWGGAMLVIPKSAYPDLDAMKTCEMTNWRRPSAGSTMAMCNGSWTYPPQDFNKKGGDWTVLLAGTNSDFCSALGSNYRTNASVWP